MPNKHTHDVGILWLASLTSIVSISVDCIRCLWVVFGMLLGIFITPDLDLAERKPGLWTLYGRAFKHRGYSHTPVIGTLTRLFYMSPVLCMIVLIVISNNLFTINWMYVAFAILGLILADTLHTIMDKTVTAFKRYWRR